MTARHRPGISRVLLVSHEASLSGAVKVAILVARVLGEGGHEVSVVSRFPGSLLDDFRAVTATSVEPFHRVRRRLRDLPLTHLLGRAWDTVVAVWVIARARPDVVYVSSAAAAVYLRPARWLGRRVLLHVHESATVARPFLDAVHAPAGLPGVELVACSPSVQSDLAGLTGRPRDTISLIPSVPDGAEVRRRAALGAARAVDDDELVVGCCGSVETRKGADLWVRAARHVLASRPQQPIRFVWVGDIAEPVPLVAGEPIEFVGPTDNPYPVVQRFDIATLPSRDDPFPLVVVESMLLAKPVVAFGVGGVPDQVGDAGVVVEPGDVDGFAAAIIALIDDPTRRRQLGEAGRRRADELYSESAFARSVVALLRSPRRAGDRPAGTERAGRVD